MNGPYMVLDDLSTFSGMGGCIVAYITDDGENALEQANDFKHIDLNDPGHTVINIEDLIEAYNTVHGTNL